VLPLHNVVRVDDADWNVTPTEETSSSQATFTHDQVAREGCYNWVQQTDLGDTLGQAKELSEGFTVTTTDLDLAEPQGEGLSHRVSPITTSPTSTTFRARDAQEISTTTLFVDHDVK
jgi:hypothetical protein